MNTYNIPHCQTYDNARKIDVSGSNCTKCHFYNQWTKLELGTKGYYQAPN